MKFQENYMALQTKAMHFQQTAQKVQDTASALVLDKTNSILKELSEKGGFDLVLTSQQLVYAKSAYNITDQVIEKLNAVNSADIIKKLEAAEKAMLAGGGQAMGGGVPMQVPAMVPASATAKAPVK
jgi:hypothetical protein